MKPTDINWKRSQQTVDNELARMMHALPDLEKDRSVYYAVKTLIEAGVGPVLYAYVYASMARPCTERPGKQHPATCKCHGSDHVFPWAVDPLPNELAGMAVTPTGMVLAAMEANNASWWTWIHDEPGEEVAMAMAVGHQAKKLMVAAQAEMKDLRKPNWATNPPPGRITP